MFISSWGSPYVCIFKLISLTLTCWLCSHRHFNYWKVLCTNVQGYVWTQQTWTYQAPAAFHEKQLSWNHRWHNKSNVSKSSELYNTLLPTEQWLWDSFNTKENTEESEALQAALSLSPPHNNNICLQEQGRTQLILHNSHIVLLLQLWSKGVLNHMQVYYWKLQSWFWKRQDMSLLVNCEIGSD